MGMNWSFHTHCLPNVEVGHEVVVHVLGGVVHPHSSCVGDHDDVLDDDCLEVHPSHGLS